MGKGRYSNQIQAVNAANDIVDVVSEHVALKHRGRNYVGLCPFHQEKTPSFNVSPERQMFKCFGCGVGGDVIKFVQNILSLSFVEALEMLARRAGIKLEVRSAGSSTKQTGSKSDIYKVNKWTAEQFSQYLWENPAAEAARNYLVGRQLEESACRKFSVGLAPSGGRWLLQRAAAAGFGPNTLCDAGLASLRQDQHYDQFRDRLMFPIFEPSGEIIGFGGRILGDGQPKYLNTPETAVFHKSRSVFGLYQARSAIQQSREVTVVEGYTDCLAASQAGVENVVATLGTALTEQHVSILRRYADQITIVFDADTAGQRAADRALEVFLTMGVDVKLAKLPTGTDPCDLLTAEGPDAFNKVLAESTDALNYKWDQLRARFDGATSTRDRRGAIDELLRAVAACDPWGKVDAIQRGMVLSRLAGMLSVSVDQLGRELQKYRRRVPARSASTDGDGAQTDRFASLSVPQNPAEAAYKELLEVLICEPGYIGSVDDLNPADFEPQTCRRIAEYLWRAHEQLGEFSLQEFVATVEEVELADIITDLYHEGNRRGNFARTVQEAVDCIHEYRCEQEVSRIAASIGKAADEDEMDRQLRELQESLPLAMRRTAGALMD